LKKLTTAASRPSQRLGNYKQKGRAKLPGLFGKHYIRSAYLINYHLTIKLNMPSSHTIITAESESCVKLFQKNGRQILAAVVIILLLVLFVKDVGAAFNR
jgi:hypothetical protein